MHHFIFNFRNSGRSIKQVAAIIHLFRLFHFFIYGLGRVWHFGPIGMLDHSLYFCYAACNFFIRKMKDTYLDKSWKLLKMVCTILIMEKLQAAQQIYQEYRPKYPQVQTVPLSPYSTTHSEKKIMTTVFLVSIGMVGRLILT